MSSLNPEDYVPVEQHEDVATSLMLSQWREKPRVMGFINSLMTSFQTIEDLVCELFDESSLDVAVGDNLDLLGDLVGVSRMGDTDAAYRENIQNAVRSSSSDGTPEKILQTLVDISGATEARIFEHYPRTVIPFLNVPYDPAYVGILKSMKPASVIANHIYLDDTGGVFTPSNLSTDAEELILDTGDTIGLDTDGNTVVDDTLAVLPELTNQSTGLAFLEEVGSGVAGIPLAEVIS